MAQFVGANGIAEVRADEIGIVRVQNQNPAVRETTLRDGPSFAAPQRVYRANRTYVNGVPNGALVRVLERAMQTDPLPRT